MIEVTPNYPADVTRRMEDTAGVVTIVDPDTATKVQIRLRDPETARRLSHAAMEIAVALELDRHDTKVYRAYAGPKWALRCSCGWRDRGPYGSEGAARRAADQHEADPSPSVCSVVGCRRGRVAGGRCAVHAVEAVAS